MNLRQNHYLAALAVATMLMGLGCGQKKEPEKTQVFIVERGNVKELMMAGGPTPVNLWTVTINPGVNPGECTSDNPAQELYINKNDFNQNDQIRFKSSTNQAYTIDFPIAAAPLAQGGAVVTSINVPASPNPANPPNFVGPFVVNFGLHPETDPQCKLAGNTCVFPYKISTNNAGVLAQCNSNNSPNKGSNDIIVKCGPNC